MDIIVIFIREKSYCKEAIYTVKYLEGYYYEILKNKEENIDNILSEDGYKKIIPFYLIEAKCNFIKKTPEEIKWEVNHEIAHERSEGRENV